MFDDEMQDVTSGIVIQEPPRVVARLRQFDRGAGRRPRLYWRVDRCPHCGSVQHEHGNYVSEDKLRALLGEPIKAECYRKSRPRYYVLVEAERGGLT